MSTNDLDSQFDLSTDDSLNGDMLTTLFEECSKDLTDSCSPCQSGLHSETHDHHRDDETSVARRENRMKRNRESAAASRNRKRDYIKQLESKVADLTRALSDALEENMRLKEAGKNIVDD